MSFPRTPRLAGLFAALAVLALPALAVSSATIGLYTDQNGSSCSFSGNDPGIVTAYVVVRPDANGVLAVRFAAPVPDCLGAVFLSESTPDGAVSIGSSPTGISVAFPFCAPEPVYALQIQYLRTGSTGSCCEFVLKPDPTTGLLEATDCAFQSFELVPVTSHFNADVSCPCNDLAPPLPPQNPSPLDGLTAVSIVEGLTWSHSPFDYDIVSYDLYFGTDPDPGFVATLTEPVYQPPQPLQELTQFYWRVVVRDDDGHTTPGPVWAFKTRAANSPPNPPMLLYPPNGSHDVSVVTPLQWSAKDIDGDALEYDVYLGIEPDIALYASHLTRPSLTITNKLEYLSDYTWYVVARDPSGHETASSTATFRTRPVNYPPNQASSPSPATNATAVAANPTLSWSAHDLDAEQVLTFDIYLGTSTAPPLVVSDHPNTSYAPPALSFATKYYWKIVTRDPFGATSTSATWNFTTRPENYAPAVPSSPSPSSGAGSVALNASLSWQCSDADGDPLTYRVYFGTSNPPPQVASGLTTKSYSPGLLAVQTTYYWQIHATDSKGAGTLGPVWSFTSQINHPPSAPSSPSPPNNASNQPLQVDLTWTCTDQDPGQTLVYDVHFGTALSPPRVATQLTAPNFHTPALDASTSYHWYVVATDNLGATKTGSLWKFTTAPTNPPALPSNPSPSDGGAVSSSSVLLQWDAATQYTQFSINFGTTSPPPFAGGSNTHSFDPGPLALGHTYYWNVTAFDGISNPTGPTWSFTTGGAVPVLFSTFKVDASGPSVRVAWELRSDETMQSYTILRRVDSGSFASIYSAPVNGTGGAFVDNVVEGGRRYHYQMMVRTVDGDEFRSPVATVSMPTLDLTLGPNHPNPFNPQTAIPYYLPASTHVQLAVYGSSGRLVRMLVDSVESAGTHEVTWNGTDQGGAGAPSGIYFCVLNAGKEQRTQKLVLLK